MWNEYDGVKFYNVNDLSMGVHLKKAAIVLDEFNENREYSDINEVIELYNIQKLIDSGAYLKEWDNVIVDRYKRVCCLINKTLGKFFGRINDDNFVRTCKSVCVGYVEDYWNLIVRFRIFKKVSGKVFVDYINESDTVLWFLLQHEDLVKYYGKELADLLRVSDQSPRLIISEFLQKHDRKCRYYFPKELLSSEYEGILQKYIHSDLASLNDLQLLVNAQSSKECPISDELRLGAKRACESYWGKHPFTGVQIECGIGIEFADVPELKSEEISGDNHYKIIYDVKWLVENLDYPTILNNFRYVFDQFDYCWRSSLVSVKSQLGVFERTLFVRGVRDYIKGKKFDFIEGLSMMQVEGYYDILRSKGIRLEGVFKWFFEEYLFQEFNISGFRFNPPSEGTTLVEKCRTIASEMEGVLKQFRLYVKNGKIDRELFEMSSEHIIFSNLSGFIKDKYAYGNSEDIQKEQVLLFSDQSHLSYIEKTKNKYRCLWELIVHEKVKFSDFMEYQQADIRWLIDHDIVRDGSDGYLELNAFRSFVLKDLYDHEVICPHYYDGEIKIIIDEWCRKGDLRLENSLFSKPEQDYLNYQLNKSFYSNGLDLRNKYAHSTYPENEKIQFADYVRMLRIMILVITKVNEEFCLKEQTYGTRYDGS